LAASEVDPGDIVLIHRELSPLSDGRAEERLLRAGVRGVVDLDDGLQWDWGYGGRARRFRPKAPKIVRMVRAADVVVAGSDTIAEWASAYAERVVVIPTCVEPSRYAKKDDFEIHDPPRIGWIGSAASEPHLATIGDELRLANRLTGARVKLLGDEMPKLGDLESIIDRFPWSESSAYAQLATWDVGVMPLPDRLMERAKCAYKLLQYGAAGLPALASSVGVNAELGDTVTSTGANHGGWSRLIDVLTGPTEEREESARALHSTVQGSFSFASCGDRWSAAVCG
jgi:glycosyltransferase involved in cell wall biosynthesis